MDAFDLGRLNPHDFEEVCKDLFELVLGRPLEIFAPGKDEGVDLRYAAPSGESNLTVVQCKHWSKSGAPSLIRHLEKDESLKIARLSPDRYILAASVNFTKGVKDRLTATLSPQCH